MGTVFEAVQQQPRRTVAVKLMMQRISSRSTMRRFEHESQTLARLRTYCSREHESNQRNSGRHRAGCPEDGRLIGPPSGRTMVAHKPQKPRSEFSPGTSHGTW